MSEKHSIRGVLYCRMSTDKQEESIPQQRDWAERTCKREGVELLAVFEDPGIAGDEIKLRPGLQALLDYCDQGGVDCVVTWNADRFSRADSIRTAALICRLLDAGVSRMLTSEGWIDFEDDTDRVLHAVKQDLGRSAYSKSLSSNVSRSCLARAREGKWNGGRLPYAYLVGPDQHLILGDPAEVETVRTIFYLIVAGMSPARVARELERLGAPRPKYGSRRWTKPTVYGIVTNRKYTGAMDYGNHHQGKYCECAAEGVRRRRRSPKTSSGRLRQVVAAPADVVIVEDAHPAIVDRELFEQAQRTLAKNRIAFRPGQPQPKRRSHSWPLSGLAYCGTCGARMYGVRITTSRAEPRVYMRRYTCGNYVVYGKDGCHNNYIREDEMLPLIFDAVREALSNPEGVHRVRQSIEGALAHGRCAGTQRASKLRQKAEELASKARQGIEKLAILPADLVDDMARQIRDWKMEREQLSAEAALLEEADARAADEQGQVEKAMAFFQELGAWLADPDSDALPPDLKAQALTTLVERIEFSFARESYGKKEKCHCTDFTVHFRPTAGLLDRLTVDVLERFPAAGR